MNEPLLAALAEAIPRPRSALPPLPPQAWPRRDSRQVQPGDIFVAQAEGPERAAHIAEALARGASLVLAEDRGDLPPDPRVQPTPAARWAFARLSCAAHRLPRATPLLAVTGTKGKSSVVHWTWAALGPGAARVGTLGWHDGQSERPNPQTTPPPEALHAFLAALPESCPGVVIEASSHGLHQHRLAGLRCAAVAVTGIGRDHLDYHGSFAAYVEAKLRIVELLAAGGRCVLNGDDALAPRFAERALARGAQPLLLATAPPPWAAGLPLALLQRLPDGQWQLASASGRWPLQPPLFGERNAWNAAAALLLAETLGVPPPLASARIAAAPPLPGRLERLAERPATFVDYAHTPESLAFALSALREAFPGRKLVVVFGCGGERDPGKRPLMGRAAAAADAIIITDDNPRREDPRAIAAAILEGVRAAGAVAEVIHERGSAICEARRRAGADGVVLVAGKGHETQQIIGDRALPWDDRAFVRALGSAEGRADGG
ncbi:MAG: UDP-N-acetylmuramoyl-L-alanyl-D-glutamate--2,6-diaminopimelate ligase [Planctomycetota bacterium]|nr:UDP-N-acetylmuramoyl-L-alanyl-D-glutamate--2,6-diaminopimelate ligase [Planctomycetota bacterium]